MPLATSILLRITSALALITLAIILYPAEASQAFVSQKDLQVALYRVSLTPATLAAAGLSSTDVAAVIADAEEHLSEQAAALASIDTLASTTQNEVVQLQQIVQSGSGTAQNISNLSAKVTTLQNAESQRTELLQELFAAATNDLTEQQKGTLDTIRSNTEWELATEFLTVNRTEAEWIQLRDALAVERVALKRGTDIDAQVQAYLAQVRSNAAVTTAAANLSANSATAISAWNGAVEN